MTADPRHVPGLPAAAHPGLQHQPQHAAHRHRLRCTGHDAAVLEGRGQQLATVRRPAGARGHLSVQSPVLGLSAGCAKLHGMRAVT